MANQRKNRTSGSTTAKTERAEALDAPTPRTERRSETIRQRREQRMRNSERIRRQQMIRRVSLGAVGLLVLVGVIWVANTLYQDSKNNKALAAVESFTVAASHVEGKVTYPQTPPTGGPHNPVWQNCGFYSAPVANENAAHSLEHGAVWITYRPDLPADQIDRLRSLTDGQTYVLVSPYPDLPAPVIASAWGKQLKLDSASDDRLGAFIKEFRQGPQTLEPGAPCTGGTSATQ